MLFLRRADFVNFLEEKFQLSLSICEKPDGFSSKISSIEELEVLEQQIYQEY